MEKAVLNVSQLKITQGMNGTTSHRGELALDLGAVCKDFKAPFTGTIKRIYTPCNAVWLESNEKVLYADGTVDYMTILTIHDNDVSNLKVGKVVKQGEIYYQPGTKGKVTGSHIHVGIGKGKFTGNGWHQGEYQPPIKAYAWPINNQYNIVKGLFLYKDVKIVNDGGYKWVITNDFKTKEPDYTGVITYQVCTNKWLPEVNKCDDTPNGYAGIGYEPITALRCKPQYGELIYSCRLRNNKWLPDVNSKNYSAKSSESYAGIIGKPIDCVRIKSTKGYVDYRVKTKEDGWLPWVNSKTTSGTESYAGIPGHTIIGIQMK